MNTLDEKILLDRLDNYWGLGKYNSDYWFVGMEEGGGSEFEEVAKRLKTWKALGSTELIDNYEYHLGISGYGYERFFEGKIKLQPTWAKLIRTYCNIENPARNYLPNDIKQFQANNWGRNNSNNCLLDIFPLPSPSANAWYYREWSDIPFLDSRESYKNALRENRIKALKNRVSVYRPKVVIFYGISDEYLRIWENIIDVEFTDSDRYEVYKNRAIYCAQRNGTTFIVTYQPSAVWNNTYWNNVGKFVHEMQ